MSWLLNVGYLLLLLLLSPWLAWNAWRHAKYREGWAAKFGGFVPRREGSRPCIWFHAVSVGEVNLLQSLLRELPSPPELDYVITTTTKAGYQLACHKYAQHLVAYCPLDFSWAVGNALRRLRPNLLVLSELELWPNLIGQADRAGVPVAIVNGRLSDNSFRGYRRGRLLIAPIVRRLAWIGAQTETYARRFVELGADPQRVVVTGSVKFDGAETDRQNPRTRQLARLARIQPQDLVFLAGSTQEPEEQMALQTFQQLVPRFPNLRLILVPRHPERFHRVADLLQQSGVAWRRRSEWAEDDSHDARVLLVDTIGELGARWGTAQLAFVGGSFGARGGQNMIEPAAYGAAVSFGPNTWNFRDVVQRLLEADAARVVADGDELTAFVRQCLESPHECRRWGQNAQRLVRANQGAARSTSRQILQLLSQTRPMHPNPAATVGSSEPPRPRKSA